MKGVQCYELFGGIALKNHTFSFSISTIDRMKMPSEMSKIVVTVFHNNTWNIVLMHFGGRYYL